MSRLLERFTIVTNIAVSSNTLVPQRLKCLGRDDRRIDEQFQPVCCLLNFAQGIAAFRDKLGFAASAVRFAIVCADRCDRTQ